MEKDPSGFQFKIFEEETKYERKKLAAKGLGVLGLFFFFLRGGRLGFLFMGLVFCRSVLCLSMKLQ